LRAYRDFHGSIPINSLTTKENEGKRNNLLTVSEFGDLRVLRDELFFFELSALAPLRAS